MDAKDISFPACKAIGLMSGTSLDGIDAALVEIIPQGKWPALKLLDFLVHPYPDALRQRLLRIQEPGGGQLQEVCKLNVLVGELFAEAATAVADKAGVPLPKIAVIGSHGQTVCHLPSAPPQGKYSQRSTLQIGEPSVIAERTGITTVADFRPRDIAAGGQGAPLLPYLHYLLFRDYPKPVLVQNIGGIANLTYISPGADLSEIVAFDTGPGNILIDGAAAELTAQPYDPDGKEASRGRLSPSLLAKLLSHPYFRLSPPKSTGRDEFGRQMVEDICLESRQLGLPPQDVLHTLTRFTAKTIANAYRDFIFPQYKVEEVLVTGGGSKNLTLFAMLAEELAPIPVRCIDELGIETKATEAVGFAILAYQTMLGQPGNIPNATGAQHPVILGKIVWGNNRRVGG